MKALTLIQPWATAILSLGKDIENRPWAPPKALIGERFALHAGAKFDKADAWNLQGLLEDAPDSYPQRALLGTVRLVGFVSIGPDSEPGLFPTPSVSRHGVTDEQAAAMLTSKWRAVGSPCMWLLSEPRLLPEPILCNGALGLWRVPVEHVAALEEL